jgi:hypothetical protein
MKQETILFKSLLIVCISLCWLEGLAQDILWEKSYGGSFAEYLSDTKPTPDYGFILAGSSLSQKSGDKTTDNHGDLDYWIWKMNEKGDLEWDKSLGGAGVDNLYSLVLTNDGGFVLAGSSASSKSFDKKEDCRGLTDYWIIKLDAKGSEQWQRTIGGEGMDIVRCILETPDGGYIVGGSSDSNISGEKTEKNYGNLDYWLVKLNSTGNIEWQRTYGGKFVDDLKSVVLSTGGGYLLSGYTNSPGNEFKSEDTAGEGDLWIMQVDKSGNVEWEKSFGGNMDDQLYAVSKSRDGGYIIGSSSNSDIARNKTVGNQNGTDLWVIKIDNEGTIKWQASFDFGKVDILSSIIENEDSTILVGAFSQGIETKSKSGKGVKIKGKGEDYIALKLTAEGKEIWHRTIGSNGEDILKRAVETRDGGYLLAGTSNGPVSGDKNTNKGSNDFWVVKLKDKAKPVKERLPVEAIPNPTSSFTNVIIGNEFKKGQLTLADLSGHILQQFPIDQTTVPINLQDYPEGIYVVNVKTDVQSGSVKIIKSIK